MSVMISLMASLLVADYLYYYCYGRLLGCKYSKKTVLIFTFVMWIYDCLSRPIPMVLFGVEDFELVSVITLLTSVAYAVFLFGSSLWKRLLVMFLYNFMTIGIDLIGIGLTTVMMGGFHLYETDSSYTIVASICFSLLVILGTFMFTWAWETFEQRHWGLTTYHWFCWLLPLSHFVVLKNFNDMDYMRETGFPTIPVLGLLLAALGDIYLFRMLLQLNEKKRIEKELQDMKEQYEREQLRYEELREKEEELAKLRHDFGNYLVVARSGENVLKES